MKICYIGNETSVHLKNWIRFFNERGHEVCVLTDRPDRVSREKIYPLLRKDYGLYNNIKNIFLVKKYISSIKPDIIHAHYVLGYGTYASFSGKHPFILSVWGSDVFNDYTSHPLMYLAVKYALMKADAIVSTVQTTAKYLENKYNVDRKKIIVNHWGIDLQIFRKDYESSVRMLRNELQIPPDSPVILSPRGLKPVYNITQICKAIPFVIKKYKNAIFVFIRGYSNPSYEYHIKKLVEYLGVSEKVRFVDKFITPQEMAVYFNMADVFISIPSHDQFASSIKEGMACGAIPVVSKNIEAYRMYLKHLKNALFVNPANPQDIAKKIIYALDNPQLRLEFHRINWEIIKRFENWEVNALKMEKLYEKCISGDCYELEDTTI